MQPALSIQNWKDNRVQIRLIRARLLFLHGLYKSKSKRMITCHGSKRRQQLTWDASFKTIIISIYDFAFVLRMGKTLIGLEILLNQSPTAKQGGEGELQKFFFFFCFVSKGRNKFRRLSVPHENNRKCLYRSKALRNARNTNYF